MQLPKHLLDAIKAGDVHVFYVSKIWRKVRAMILARDNYECQRCKKLGIVTLATCVHHKEHLKDNPLRALDPANLISLCDRCHDLEHPEKIKKMQKKNKKTSKSDFLASHVERW